MQKLFEIMEICSNICSLRDAPLSRPFSVSAFIRDLRVCDEIIFNGSHFILKKNLADQRMFVLAAFSFELVNCSIRAVSLRIR